MFQCAKPPLKETVLSEMVTRPKGVDMLLLPRQTIVKEFFFLRHEEFSSLLLENSVCQNSSSVVLLFIISIVIWGSQLMRVDWILLFNSSTHV